MSNLLSLIGWTFLPNLVTSWTQTILYSLTIRAGDPKPRPGSPKFAEHRRRIHIAVVSLYLLYTIYEADHDIRRAGSFHSDLSLPISASDRDIKSRFRRLAAIHHPDKAAGGQQDADSVNAYFVHLKTASDTLLDPARRFAYERFGPDVVTWASHGKCVTVRDFVVRGGQLLVPYYAVAAGVMYALGLFGYLDWARYERWLVLAVMFVFELDTVMRPGRPAVFERLVDPLMRFWTGRETGYLPFQIIALARKLSITIYVAFSQIGPLIGADTSSGQIVVGGKKGGSDEKLLAQNLDRLEGAAKSLDVDMGRLLQTEMAPFAGDEQVVQSMKGKMKEWLVQNTIRQDPMVRDALGRAFQRRRADAPAGARGTR
ncbi:hypothetical protein GE09DRAFT_1222177 [Coniochaeta sp. 2T2.1]|nr:hypothetical protein GE09DRAFT_1222177 [Coniochaeta sp. 2T2.1]